MTDRQNEIEKAEKDVFDAREREVKLKEEEARETEEKAKNDLKDAEEKTQQTDKERKEAGR